MAKNDSPKYPHAGKMLEEIKSQYAIENERENKIATKATQKEIKNYYKRKILNYSLRTLDDLNLNDLTHKLSYKYKYF